MVNSCVVIGCRSGYESEKVKISMFKFPSHKRKGLKEKWIKFVDRKNWYPSKNSVLCSKHFDKKFIITGDVRTKLNWFLNPVPTIYGEEVLRYFSINPTPPLPEADSVTVLYQNERFFEFLPENVSKNVLNKKDFNSLSLKDSNQFLLPLNRLAE